MLKYISLSNFKSFKEVSNLELGSLTVLSGLNSSGKSSIYQALNFFVQTEDSHDRENYELSTNGILSRMGLPSEVLHDSKNSEINFKFKWTDESFLETSFVLKLETEKLVLNKISYEKNLKKSELVSYDATFDKGKWKVNGVKTFSFEDPVKAMIIQKMIQDVDKGADRFYENEVSFEAESVKILSAQLHSIKIKFDQFKNCIQPKYHKCLDEKLFEKMSLNNGLTYDGTITLKNSFLLPLTNVNSSEYLFQPAFRGHPERLYVDSVLPNPLGQFQDKSDIELPYKYDFVSKEAKKGKIDVALRYWLKDRFSLVDDVYVEKVLGSYASAIMVKIGNKKFAINNVGFGVSQILPVIYQVLQSPTKKMFVIDEPEVHLHPQLQSKLADFFFEMALIEKQIIIETHSEYLINKLIYLNIKCSEHRDKVKLYWVAREAEQSKVYPIDYDELGFVKNSPMGFLSEQKKIAEELNEIRLANLNRK